MHQSQLTSCEDSGCTKCNKCCKFEPIQHVSKLITRLATFRSCPHDDCKHCEWLLAPFGRFFLPFQMSKHIIENNINSIEERMKLLTGTQVLEYAEGIFCLLCSYANVG